MLCFPTTSWGPGVVLLGGLMTLCTANLILVIAFL